MAEVAELSVAVEKHLWQYLKNSNTFQEELAKVTEAGDVTVNSKDSGAELMLTGKCRESVEQARARLDKLFEDYQKKLETKSVAITKAELLTRIVEVPGEFQNGAYLNVNPDTGTVYIVGTQEEVAFSEGRIIEQQAADLGDEVPTLESDVEQTGSERSHNNRQNDSQVVQIDSELWKYMQKNVNYDRQTRRIREDMHVDVVESVVVGDESLTRTQLMISGPTDDVNSAVEAAKELIEVCENSSTTLRVPCPDNRIFSKITKMLRVLNKNKGLVSADNGTVSITGSESELADCREKLEKLGLTFSDQSKPEVGQPLNGEEQPITSEETVMSAAPRQLETSDDIARQQDFGSFHEVLSRDSQQEQLEADARYAASLEREEAGRFGGLGGGFGDFDSGFRGGFGGSAGANNEVPVEHTLWQFVEQRRQSNLQELNDTLGLRVIPDKSQENFVMLHLEADSPDMVEIGRDALLAMLNPLQESVVAVHLTLNTNTELPREVKQLIEQVTSDTDALVHFIPSKLVIIGPQAATEVCQQKIAELFQQLSAQGQQNQQIQGDMQGQFGMGLGRGNPMAGLGGDMSRGGMMPQNMSRRAIMGPMGGDSQGLSEISLGNSRMMGGGGGGGLMEGGAGMTRSMIGGGDGMMNGSPAGMMRSGGGGGFPGMIGRGGGMMGRESGIGMLGGAGGLSERMGRGGGMPALGGMNQRMISDEIGPSSGMFNRMNPLNGPDEMSARQPTISDRLGQMPGRQGGMISQMARATGRGTDQSTGVQIQELTSSHTSTGRSSTAHDFDNEDDADFFAVVTGRKQPGSDPVASQQKQVAESRADEDDEPGRREDVRTQEASSSRVANTNDSQAGPTVRSEPVKSEERKWASTAADAETKSLDACAVCQVGPHYFAVGKKCPHAFCVTCIQSYFSTGEYECPVCGIEYELVGHKPTQPSNGRMLVTHDNKLKLPGHESTSRGTIIVTYAFPAGVQSDDMLEPGRHYANFTRTAFFPESPEGSRIVELLQLAFEARILFIIKRSKNETDDELDWNGVRHKTSVFGGPPMNGYPDPVYMKRVSNELAAKGVKCV